MNYSTMVMRALRDVVRQALQRAAESGLPEDHHFFITFLTMARGVELSDRLRQKFPSDMTIVLQHRFWNLTVDDAAFEVDLTFDNISEHLRVPFSAILNFTDPSVEFVLPFQGVDEALEAADESLAPERDGEVISLEAFRKK